MAYTGPSSSSLPKPVVSSQRLMRAFKCPHCPRSVNTSQGLKSHITRKHSGEGGNLRSSVGPSLPDIHGLPTSSPDVSHSVSDHTVSSPEESFEKTLSCNKKNIPALRRIPKGARGLVAEALTEAIDSCVTKGTAPEWKHMLLFPALCLQVPHSREEKKHSLTALVKMNVSDYKNGAVRLQTQASSSGPRSQSLPFNRSKYVQTKLAEGDVRGAVRLLSSVDTVAPVNSSTLEALQALHPEPLHSAPQSPSALDSRHSPLRVTSGDVLGAVSSFPAGSAGGLDLLRPQHLKDLTSHSAGAAGSLLLDALTNLCNLMLAGGVPECIQPILYGATLCAFVKPKGGIRPIAIGCTYRRLVAKLSSFHLSANVGTHLQPTQHGFGFKRGLEVATHAARRFANFPHTSAKTLLKVDFRNAFNSIHRHCILQSVSTMAPALYRFVHQCYAGTSLLLFGNDTIQSVRGVQQGDPLGPGLFCLVMQPIIDHLQSELNIWYLDDGFLGGEPDAVLRDFSHLKNHSEETGLEINEFKCELFILNATPDEETEILRSFHNIAPGLPLVPIPLCTQLGSPLFPSEIENHLREKTDTLRLMTSRMTDLPPHCAFYILKNSQAIPKLTHLLRCCPTWLFPTALKEFDLVLRDSLSSILNVSLSELAWTQSSWPTARGGLGIRHALDLALPTFLSSVHGSLSHVESRLPPVIVASADEHTTEGISRWTELSNHTPPQDGLNNLQKEWERPLQDLSISTVKEQANNFLDKARLLSVSSPESGAFLNALPSPQLGTFMDADTFRIAVALRLGSPVCQPHECVCGTQVDDLGLHGLSCRRSAGRLSRHASVNNLIQRALTSANVPSSLEPNHLALSSNVRPDGVTRIPWKAGLSLTWDYTCADSLAPSHLEDAAVLPLATAAKSEGIKRVKYAYLEQSHIFIPIASECLGSFGKEGMSLLREIGRRITTASGEKQALSYLLQRISVEIQRGNARSIMGTFPTSDSLNGSLSLL